MEGPKESNDQKSRISWFPTTKENSFQVDKSLLNQRIKWGVYDPSSNKDKERTDELVRRKERALESFMVVSFLLIILTTANVFLSLENQQLQLFLRSSCRWAPTRDGDESVCLLKK